MQYSENVIKAEFSEEDFISGLETALARTRYRPWQLEISRVTQDAEHSLGYDGILNSLVPFYIQFKRPSFCQPSFQGKVARQRNEFNLSTGHGFYQFSLHKDKSTGSYIQHNALFKLSEHAHTAYVSPLFYKASQLSAFKKMSLNYPWRYEDVDIYDYHLERLHNSKKNRAFQNCITVPPHRMINDKDASHFYSFTKTGSLCFHSDPEVPQKNTLNLYEFLSSLVNYLSARSVSDQNPFDLSHFARLLLNVLPELYDLTWENRSFRSLIKAYLLELDFYPHNKSPAIQTWVFEQLDTVDILLLAEHMLLIDFDIVQYLGKVS